MNKRRVGWRCAPALCVAALAGCYGGVSQDPNEVGGGTSMGGSDTESGPGGSDGETDPTGGVVADELPAPTTRFFRLTHEQWENTIQDLFYLDAWTGLSSNFRSDPLVGGYLFDNSATSLEVDQALWGGYQRAAADVAALVTADPTLKDAILPPDSGDDGARSEAFVRDFGLRAFRRPLTEDEVLAYTARFAGATDLYEDVSGFDAGVRLVLETMLQSPHFVYRVESSDAPAGEVIPLSNFEVASRVSYFLWDSMPDDELLDLALEDGLESRQNLTLQVRRLLDDPRAKVVIEKFHDTVFEGERMENAAPSAAVYPGVPDTIGELAREELHLFVDDVVLAQGGSLRELFTSTQTFVNQDLAAIYGLEGNFGAEFTAAELDPSQRRGIFTQVGFLAANASSVNPDPIHRGKFLSQRITCSDLPAPPDVIPPLPDVQGETNRESIEQLTEAPGTNCAGCHATLINPYGFPFENYDAVGGWRTEDEGFPVDASSTVSVDGASVSVESALELIDALAQSKAVHDCYLEHWVEFAAGRKRAPEDEALIDRLGTLSSADDTAIKELLVELATSQPFLTRSTEELQ